MSALSALFQLSVLVPTSPMPPQFNRSVGKVDPFFPLRQRCLDHKNEGLFIASND